MLPFFAWKIFSISFFISLDFYLQVLSLQIMVLFKFIYASYAGTVPFKKSLSYASLFLISFLFNIFERFSAVMPFLLRTI